MKRFVQIGIVVLLVGVLGISLLSSVSAQDEMMTHTCDSTLISLLFVAEYEYGFHSMMDVSTFDKGQYAPLFEQMMMMDDGMMDDMGDGEMMDDTTDGEMMDDSGMMDDMMMLPVGNIEGEDEACTALRAELDTFMYDTLSAMMMADDMGDGQ